MEEITSRTALLRHQFAEFGDDARLEDVFLRHGGAAENREPVIHVRLETKRKVETTGLN